MVKMRWHDAESETVRRWKRNDTMMNTRFNIATLQLYHHFIVFFTIVPSCFHHRDIVPSRFHHRTIVHRRYGQSKKSRLSKRNTVLLTFTKSCK
jgi:hypothetical protein